MAQKILRIGTRESQLAVWQATLVQDLLQRQGTESELVYIKSEGDIDTVTPLYELGVQGIFTKTLDAALLAGTIDMAVHSMKDVPTIMARGLQQAAVLQRASYQDLFVYKMESDLQQLGYKNGKWTNALPEQTDSFTYTVATSSIRRKAQWLNRYPHHRFDNLRGNVNTRLRKLSESNWQGAIFAAAGLERIGLRPEQSVALDWMLPAPAQGAIMIVCRAADEHCMQACKPLNDAATETCAAVERDFLRGLMGGCSTPISALARIEGDQIFFKGNIVSPDGRLKAAVEQQAPVQEAARLGIRMAQQLRADGGQKILDTIKQKGMVS